jgi:hypothetical protein
MLALDQAAPIIADDVLVVQPLQDFHLPLEPGEHSVVGRELRREDLERNLLPRFEVGGPIHDAHAAHAQFVFDFKRTNPPFGHGGLRNAIRRCGSYPRRGIGGSGIEVQPSLPDLAECIYSGECVNGDQHRTFTDSHPGGRIFRQRLAPFRSPHRSQKINESGSKLRSSTGRGGVGLFGGFFRFRGGPVFVLRLFAARFGGLFGAALGGLLAGLFGGAFLEKFFQPGRGAA